MLVENVGHSAEIFVQQEHEVVGAHSLGQCGEVADVTKHDGEFLDFSAGPYVLLRVFLNQGDDAGREVLREALANRSFLPLLRNDTETDSRQIREDQGRCWNHKAEPAAKVGKAEVDEAHEQAQNDNGGDGSD